MESINIYNKLKMETINIYNKLKMEIINIYNKLKSVKNTTFDPSISSYKWKLFKDQDIVIADNSFTYCLFIRCNIHVPLNNSAKTHGIIKIHSTWNGAKVHDVFDEDNMNKIFGDEPEESMLFEHQLEFKSAIIESIHNGITRVQALMGTGSGKSTVLPHIINELDSNTYYIGVPRIKLADDVISILENELKKLNVFNDYIIMPIHSSSYTNENDNILNATSNVLEMYNNIKRASNKKVILVSTYHSSEKIGEVLNLLNRKIDVSFFDEAHNISINKSFINLIARGEGEKYDEFLRLVEQRSNLKEECDINREEQEALYNKINDIVKDITWIPNDTFLPSEHYVFITATQTSEQARGNKSMCNKDLFGDIVYSKSFCDLANDGFLIRPAIDNVKHDDSLYDIVDGMFGDQQEEKFKREIVYLLYGIKTTIEKYGYIKGIVYYGDTERVNVLSDIAKVKLQTLINNVINVQVKVYGLTCNTSFNERVDIFNRFSENENAILLNCKILSEGVDIPNLNSVLVCRSSNSIELSQIIGRVARLDKDDMKSILNKDIIPSSTLEGYSKKGSTLFFPTDLNLNRDSVVFREYLETMVRVYNETCYGVFQDHGTGNDMIGGRLLSMPKEDALGLIETMLEHTEDCDIKQRLETLKQEVIQYNPVFIANSSNDVDF